MKFLQFPPKVSFQLRAVAKRDVHGSDSDSGEGSPQPQKEVNLLVSLPPKVVKLGRVYLQRERGEKTNAADYSTCGQNINIELSSKPGTGFLDLCRMTWDYALN